MFDYPSHTLPNFSDEARDDALFHYTSAAGLAGIFDSKAIWSTAYYCANDEQELAAGKGVLTTLFREELYSLEQSDDPRIRTFYGRGVDPIEYAEHFEGLVTSLALGALCPYITCFCRPAKKEDFLHGLLSQWRGYGPDGGYALQFSRKKLAAALDAAKPQIYELRDVHYDAGNDLKASLLQHKPAFLAAFSQHLDQLAMPIDLQNTTWESPLASLFGGPLESLFDFLVYTKNQHFAEERECRMSAIQTSTPTSESRAVRFFNRNGLLVPYVSTPVDGLDILGCIEWIVVGPGPRIQSRFQSITHLVRQHQREIHVRVSHIPYTRL